MSGNSALGRVGIALESLTNPGLQLVLGPTPVSSLPASLTTQPNAVPGRSVFSGARLLIDVRGNFATGTIIVTGKDFTQAISALVSTTPTIPIASTSAGQQPFEYVTPGIYSTVDASGVTVTGLTGGIVRIWAIPAASSLTPAMLETPEEKIAKHSPEEQRGTLSRNTNFKNLNKVVDVGKFEQDFYLDNCAEWFGRSVVGSNPSQATIPASPTVLKTTTAVATFPISLTTQPNTIGPGSILQLVVTGSSAVGTVVITGTNIFGQTITETVICGMPAAANGNGTFYTQQVFASVAATGVALGGGLTGGSVAINGIIGIQETYQVGLAGTGAGDILQSVTLEQYTGVDALVHPLTFFEEVTIEGGTEKENKVTCKGGAQDQLAIGDRTTLNMENTAGNVPFGAIGALSALWQPQEVGIGGWQTAWFIDPLSGTAGTTAYNQVLDWKLIFKIPRTRNFPAVNSQRLQSVTRKQRETEIELTILFEDLIQYEKYRQNVKQLLVAQFLSNIYMGTTGGTTYFKNWTFTFPAKIIEAKRDASKLDRVEAKIKFSTEYTDTLGYEIKFVSQNQLPPNYAA